MMAKHPPRSVDEKTQQRLVRMVTACERQKKKAQQMKVRTAILISRDGVLLSF